MVLTVVVDVDKCFQFKRRPMPFRIYHAVMYLQNVFEVADLCVVCRT